MADEPTPHADNPRPRKPRPVLVRRREAAALCGMGTSTFDRADAAGLIPAARKVGGCKLWSVAELRAWAARGCPPRAEWTPVWAALVAAGRTRTVPSAGRRT